MLTRKELLKLMRQESSCPICYSGKSSRVWRQLPCNHCCCEKCLEDWTHKSNGGKDANSQGKRLSCPFCRDCAVLPPEGIKAFPAQCSGPRKDLLDIMEFLKNTPVVQQSCHSCALCPYDIGDITSKLFHYCCEGHLNVCDKCICRFSVHGQEGNTFVGNVNLGNDVHIHTLPSAPPPEDTPKCIEETKVLRSQPLNSLWMKERTSSKGRYSDAVFVAKDKIVICDSNKNQLLLLDAQDGKCIVKMKTSYRPFSLAYNEEKNTVLVTKYNSTSLSHLDAHKLKETRSAAKLKAAEEPQGVALLPDGNTVIAETNKTIAVYDDSAKCVMRTRCGSQGDYVTATNDAIVVSFRDGNSVIAYDQNGNQAWETPFQQPRGVSIDKDKVLVVHEGSTGRSELSVCCLKSGRMLGQLEVPSVDMLPHHNQDRLIKALPGEGKLLLVYNHFVQMTTF